MALPPTSPAARSDPIFSRKLAKTLVNHSTGVGVAGKAIAAGPDGKLHPSFLPNDLAELPEKFNDLITFLLSLGFELPESLLEKL